MFFQYTISLIGWKFRCRIAWTGYLEKDDFDIEILPSRDGARFYPAKNGGEGCFRHPCIVYWKDSPKKVFFAKDFAVTNKALVLQCFVAVRTFQALWVPIVVQDFQDKSVENEKTTTCALRYSCCNKWTVIHKLCDLLWNSLKDTISSSAAFLVLPNKVAYERLLSPI